MFDVDVLDEEPKALHKLIKAIDQKFDDRRFAIELQFNDDLTIAEERPLCMFYQKLSYEARWKRHPPAAQAA
jgi:hypothetical protein